MFKIPLPASLFQKINAAFRMRSRRQEHAGEGEHIHLRGERSRSRQAFIAKEHKKHSEDETNL